MQFTDFPEVEAFCLEAIQKWPLCPHPYPLLIDMALTTTTTTTTAAAGPAQAHAQTHAHQRQTAVSYCDKLAHELDVIRKKYWLWRKQLLLSESPSSPPPS
jgi:hypothetical protein